MGGRIRRRDPKLEVHERMDAQKGSKVASVRSLAGGQAAVPKEDEQGAQRWWAVRKGVFRGCVRVCAMGKAGERLNAVSTASVNQLPRPPLRCTE